MVIVAVAVAWVAMGVIAVAVMGRRGHDPFGWAVLFLFLGPLALPWAFTSDRHRPPPPVAPRHEGGLDVLVAHEGSPEDDAALEVALNILGGQLTSLTIAAVVDLEAPTTVRGRDTQREAQERLDNLARRAAVSTTAPVDTVILFGEPSHALQHFAAEHGYELIVAGSRASGRAPLATRKVAQRLATAASVPVLIGPSAP